MRMDEMKQWLEREGFEVDKEYFPRKQAYKFDIFKDGVRMVDWFSYPKSSDYQYVDKCQKAFLRNLMCAWKLESSAVYGKKGENKMTSMEFVMELARADKPVTLECGGKSVNVKVTEVEHDRNYYGDTHMEVTCEVLSDMDIASLYPSTPAYVKRALNSVYGSYAVNNKNYGIEKVIFNDPATIVIWTDGSKTVVKTQNDEPYDREKGLAMAISKRALGDKGNYYDTFKKYIPDVEKETINEDDVAGVWMSLEDAKSITNAYKSLTKIMNETKVLKADMVAAIEEATGYLGEVLE